MVSSKKILVVDDEPDLREILQCNLENAGYEVVTAASAEEAIALLSPDIMLVLLDVMLGGMSGFRMAEKMRKELHNDTPIIFLTAKDAEKDLLTGFSAGGDDYICKPFSLHEVLARISAVLRRSGTEVSKPKTLTSEGRRCAFRPKSSAFLALWYGSRGACSRATKSSRRFGAAPTALSSTAPSTCISPACAANSVQSACASPTARATAIVLNKRVFVCSVYLSTC